MSSRSRLDAAAQNSNPIPYSNKTSLTPPSTTPSIKSKKGFSARSVGSRSREVTPREKSKSTVEDGTLLSELRSDVSGIRSVVTCTICDLLLFEPFSLGCGHTYCYTCLCAWFVDNRHKKTCPECRARVRVMPSQNYLIKSVVEIIAGQTNDLMPLPAGEKIEDRMVHRTKETKAMEADKNSAAGLFKGTFVRRRRLWRDDEDGGILRCPSCGHEHEGGPSCNVCGEELEVGGDDFSDYEDDDDLHLDDDLDNVEIDLDAESEVDAEFAAMHGHHRFHDSEGFARHHRHHFQHPAILDEAEDLTNSDDSENFYDSEEDPGSLDGFVVHDEDEEPRGGRTRNRAANSQPITINLTSDDDSDEGGAISNGRPRRRFQPQHSTPPPAVPDALTISDGSSVRDSDYDETQSEADVHLYEAGWSPLDNGNDSEIEAQAPYTNYGYAYADFTDDGEGHDESDSTNTSTIDGDPTRYHARNDGEDGHESDSSSQDPNGYLGNYSSNYSGIAGHYHSLGEDEDEGAASAAGIDRDGDTEMSASSRSSRGQSESLTPNARAREASEPLTDYDGDRLTEGDTFDGLTADGRIPSWRRRDASEPITDYGADRITDEESVYGYGDAPHRHQSIENRPSYREYTPNFTPHSPPFESPDYNRNSHGVRGASEQSDYNDPDTEDFDSGYRIQTIHQEPEEESSDASIRGPVRRRQPRQPRQYSAASSEAVRVHHHNLVEPVYTDSRRERGDGAWYNPINIDGASDEWEGAIRSVGEPSDRRRRVTAYRHMPARRIDPLRSSRSPSVNRIISSSSRGSRYPRQYQRRG